MTSTSRHQGLVLLKCFLTGPDKTQQDLDKTEKYKTRLDRIRTDRQIMKVARNCRMDLLCLHDDVEHNGRRYEVNVLYLHMAGRA